MSPHLTTKKQGTESVGFGVKGTKQHDCSQVAGPEVESLWVFPVLSFCNAVSPGSYPEADGQNYMGNQREEVASFVSHMSRGRGGAWARFCSSLLGRCPPEPHCSPGVSVLGLEGPQNQAVGGQGRIGVRRVYIGP